MSSPKNQPVVLLEKVVDEDACTAAQDHRDRSPWEKALGSLSLEDRERFHLHRERTKDHLDLLQAVLTAANQKKAESLEKRWRIVRGKRTIIIRDTLEKVAVWVNTFVKVGDTMVAFDPGHVALPWAAIRFFLQVTVNDIEIYGGMLQSVELISNILGRCLVMEHLYLNRSLEVTDQIFDALVELYAVILVTLAKILRYYSHNAAKRIAKSIVSSPKDVDASSLAISKNMDQVERLAAIAEGEKARHIAQNIELLRTEHQDTDRKLEEQDQKLTEFLQGLKGPILRIDSGLSDLHDNLQMEDRVKILKAISTIPYPVHHKTVARDRLQGSGKWLLEEPVYRNWRSESSSSVVWVHGIPGSGKTKLASLVIDDMKGSVHLGYFYCMRNPSEPERAECDKILRCLVRQLASVSPRSPILEPVCLMYESAIDGFEGFEDHAWTVEESIQVLTDLTNTYPSVTFVLDAVDEVNYIDRLQLLDALDSIMRTSTSLVKIFISSRDSVDIVMHLENSPNLYISATQNEGDINAFINQRLDTVKLLHGQISAQLRDKIVGTLIDGAHGMFRWVDLQIQSLRSLKVAADIEARLGHLPESLEASYWEIYQQIQSSGDNAAKIARFTFQWLLSAKSTINLGHFAILASLSSETPGVTYTASEILDVCANLVTADGAASFRFVHLSVREFLESLSKRKINAFQLAETNAAISSVCLTYLMNMLSVHQRLLVGERTKVSPEESRTFGDERLVKDYALKYWPHHVFKSGPYKHVSPLAHQVQAFLVEDKAVSSHYKLWCEEVRKSSIPETDLIQVAARDYPKYPIWIAIQFDLMPLEKFEFEAGDIDRDAFVNAIDIADAKVVSALLENGISIKEVENYALNVSAKKGHNNIVSILLKHGVLVGPKALYWAVLLQHPGLIDLLLNNGSHNLTTFELSKVLTTAASNGDSDVVAILIRNGAVRENVAVARALRNGTIRAANNLIDHDFDIHGKYLIQKRTALHWAAEKGYFGSLEKLLQRSVSLDVKDEYEDTPLHLASRRGHSSLVSRLLHQGANINTQNVAFRTPLHLASMMSHPQTVEILVDHGPDLSIKDVEGWTSLQLAQLYQHQAVINIISPPKPSQVVSQIGDELDSAREITSDSADDFVDTQRRLEEIVISLDEPSDSKPSQSAQVPRINLTSPGSESVDVYGGSESLSSSSMKLNWTAM